MDVISKIPTESKVPRKGIMAKEFYWPMLWQLMKNLSVQRTRKGIVERWRSNDLDLKAAIECKLGVDKALKAIDDLLYSVGQS